MIFGTGGHAIEVTPNQQIIWDADYNFSPFNDPAGNYRSYRIPSIHPNAHSIIFDNYKNDDSGTGIYLSDNNLKITIYNESGYKQIYNYSMSDSEEWFEILDTEIIIDPYSNID